MMTSQKCCICGKQNKKNLRSIFSNCDIVGKNSGNFLCNQHKEQLGEFLAEIGIGDKCVQVRFDKRFDKFFLVPSHASFHKVGFPLEKSLMDTSTQSIACHKALLDMFAKKLECTVCGEQSSLYILPATYELEPVSTVQMACKHCNYVFEFSETTPQVKIIFQSSTPTKSQSALPSHEEEEEEEDDVSDSSASSQGSSPLAEDDDEEAISPQQAASALLSLERTPAPSNNQDTPFGYTKRINFQTVSPRMTSTFKKTSTSTSSSTRISISRTTTTSSTSVGFKRLRSEDQDTKLQEARAQAPKKRRLESFAKISSIKVQPTHHALEHTRLPSVIQSFPMERLPSFEDLAVTLKTIVPYGLDHAQ